MQVHVRTNIAPSKALEDRSRAAHVVIRLLRGEIASIRFLYNEEYRLSEGGETVAFAYIRYTTTLQPFPTSRKAVFLHLPIQRKWLYHTPHKAVFLYHQETKERSRSP